MSIHRALLSSVALIAPSIGFALPAVSAPQFPDWYFAVEGGPIFAAPTVSTINHDGSGATATFGEQAGGFGAATLGSVIDANRDWRVRLAYSAFNNTAHTDLNNTDPRGITSGLSLTTADFDVGFRRAMGAGEFRAFAGLSALAVSDRVTEDKLGSGGIDNALSTEFVGIGPRAGISFEHALAGQGWGFSGSIAGSAVFGQRQIVAPNTTSLVSSAQTILSAEGELGLDYRPSNTGRFTVGVRAEQWWNVRQASDLPQLTVRPDVLDWGPFVRWTMYAP